MTASELLVNADFDLSLCPRPHSLASPQLNRQIAELGLHCLLAAEAGDSVLVPLEPPAELVEHLVRHGIRPPEATVLPAIRAERRFVPHGWDRRAAELNRRYRQPSLHPPLDVVRRINGRRWGNEAETRLFGSSPVVACLDSFEALTSCLSSQPEHDGGWIVKAEHGNAGMGNRRLRSRRLSEVDARVVHNLFAANDWLILETWCKRATDLCLTFELAADGTIHQVEVHEVVNTSDGAFIGAIFDAASPLVSRWQPQLEEAAQRIGALLAQEGYFGPVCIDAFVFSDRGRPRLRLLADLNARSHMSASALRLWRSWGRSPCLYWRFFNRRKLRLPAGYGAVQEALKTDAFDPDRRRGVLLTSPLSLGPGQPRPLKLGMILAGQDRSEVLEMERRVRNTFES